jgi:very-short-patch-repair endonuclease
VKKDMENIYHPPFDSLPLVVSLSNHQGREEPIPPPNVNGDNPTMQKSATNKARELRQNSTDTERLLWKHLRAKRFEGLKFRRQEPIGKYIVDFVSFEKRVIVEVDGSHHIERNKQDDQRTQWLENQGFRILRFWNNDVLKNIQGVIETIHQNCNCITPSVRFPKGSGMGGASLP